MEHTLKHVGVNQDRIIKESLRRYGRLPKNFANQPTLWVGLDLFMEAFWDLSTTRPASESGVLPIPWSAIKLWCDEYELDADLRHDMFHHIRKLDVVFMEHRAAKMRQKNSAK